MRTSQSFHRFAWRPSSVRSIAHIWRVLIELRTDARDRVHGRHSGRQEGSRPPITPVARMPSAVKKKKGYAAMRGPFFLSESKASGIKKAENMAADL